MPKTLIYAIHGFLGNSSDWDIIKSCLDSEVLFIAEDIFSKKQSMDFFLERVDSFKEFQCKKIFLGYSMGGRLGLQILKKCPESFDHYVFLSTNIGLPAESIEDRERRVLNDQRWSEKISLENWDIFLKEWNSQNVFQGSKAECQRHVEQYDLFKLKESLVKWSLGFQEDFSDVVKEHNSKITWVVGDRDEKYCEMAESLKSKNILLDFKKVSSGHRLWLDHPEAVANILKILV